MIQCPHCRRPVRLPAAVESNPSKFVGGDVRTTCCRKLFRVSTEIVLTIPPSGGMKVIIAGSRHMPFSMYPLIGQAVTKSGYKITEVVCGMARGADMFGAKWAYEQGIPIKKFPANWEEFGLKAGPIRNAEMAQYADAAIIFIWDGSRGSADMERKMKALKKPVFTVWNGEIDYAF